MNQLQQFITNHFTLCLFFLGVLVAALLNEWRNIKQSTKKISPQTLVSLINDETINVIDTRDVKDFRKGHIIQAIQANQADFTENRMDEYKTKKLVLVCANGMNSLALANQLRQKGFTDICVLSGGIQAWQQAGFPLTH